MKHLTFYVIALLSLIVSPGLLQAQTMSAGKVQAFIVQGNVQLVAKDGTASPLKRGQIFEEGNIVKAGPDGQALLVFSNGATMKVLANCQLSVDQFQQAPFDEQAEGTFLRLSKDPSKSTTTLDLRNGTLQGEVKQLNQAAGSKFTVNTPAGSAGIRGTIISITVVRDANGNITGITCHCAVGAVAFTPSTTIATGQTNTGAANTTQTATNNNVSDVSVGSGAELVVQLTVNPNTGQISSGAISGNAMTTASAQDLANALVDTVNTAKTQAGLAPQPPPVITVTQAPVQTTSNGTTSTVTQNTAVTITPTTTTAASGDTTYSSSPPVTVVTTTPTAPPATTTVNTNPSTVSTF